MYTLSEDEKLQAIKNILEDKPVMIGVTVYFAEDEDIRIFDRILNSDNNDGIIMGNTFQTEDI